MQSSSTKTSTITNQTLTRATAQMSALVIAEAVISTLAMAAVPFEEFVASEAAAGRAALHPAQVLDRASA
ncbi:MAG: hypothetical protein KGJ66_02465 [Alphaproteobacteria bacterium]|nr:hypothetical protein [Alphaproteobacteria bacterium]